jgi:hypothetical protein
VARPSGGVGKLGRLGEARIDLAPLRIESCSLFAPGNRLAAAVNRLCTSCCLAFPRTRNPSGTITLEPCRCRSENQSPLADCKMSLPGAPRYLGSNLNPKTCLGLSTYGELCWRNVARRWQIPRIQRFCREPPTHLALISFLSPATQQQATTKRHLKIERRFHGGRNFRQI